MSFNSWKEKSISLRGGYPYSLAGSVSHTHRHTQCKRQQRQLMKTIFVPSQRTRSPSHNCQSCNKSLCGTNEYGIGNETKLIGMLCQLDSIHPPFHTRPFICEVVRGCLSLFHTLPLLLSHTHTNSLSRSLSLTEHQTHTCAQATRLMWKLHRVNVCGQTISAKGCFIIITMFISIENMSPCIFCTRVE